MPLLPPFLFEITFTDPNMNKIVIGIYEHWAMKVRVARGSALTF